MNGNTGKSRIVVNSFLQAAVLFSVLFLSVPAFAQTTGTVSIAAASATNTAEGSSATFTVTASQTVPAGNQLGVRYSIGKTPSTSDDDAEAGDFGNRDNTLQRSSYLAGARVIIPAGATTATITVPIFDDGAAESAESYRVTLIGFQGSATAGTITYSLATSPHADGTIASSTGPSSSNPSRLTVSVGEPAGHSLEGGTALFPVSFTGRAVGNITVPFRLTAITTGFTASDIGAWPTDAPEVSGRTCAAGLVCYRVFTPKEINTSLRNGLYLEVPIAFDNAAEPDESFHLEIVSSITTSGSTRSLGSTISNETVTISSGNGRAFEKIQSSQEAYKLVVVREAGTSASEPERDKMLRFRVKIQDSAGIDRAISSANLYTATLEVKGTATTGSNKDTASADINPVSITQSANCGNPAVGVAGSLELNTQDRFNLNFGGTASGQGSTPGVAASGWLLCFQLNADSVSDAGETFILEVVSVRAQGGRQSRPPFFRGSYYGRLPGNMANLRSAGSDLIETVTITAPPGPGVTVSSKSLSVNEGSSDTYNVSLASAPSADLTISISSNNHDVTVNPSTLTFTTSNFGTEQTVTVTAADDTDFRDDSAILSHSITSGPASFDSSIESVVVSVNDTGTPVVSVDFPSVTEGDSGTKTMTFTVTLSGASDRVINVPYVLGGTAESGTDYRATPNIGNVSFAQGETSKIISFSIVGDTTPEAHETIQVTLDQPYSRAPNEALPPATFNDNLRACVAAIAGDSPGNCSIAAIGYIMNDDGTTLATSNLAISTSSPTSLNSGNLNSAVLNMTLSSGTFGSAATTATNYELVTSIEGLTINTVTRPTTTTLTITLAYPDTAPDFYETKSIAVIAKAAAHSGTESLTSAPVSVAVAPATTNIVVSKQTLALEERSPDDEDNDNIGTYTVVLTQAPTTDVVITVESTNSDVVVDTDSETALSQDTLTFTSTNYATAQTVTVTAYSDIDNFDSTARLTHSITTAGGPMYPTSLNISSVLVTLSDVQQSPEDASDPNTPPTPPERGSLEEELEKEIVTNVVREITSSTVAALSGRISTVIAGSISGAMSHNDDEFMSILKRLVNHERDKDLEDSVGSLEQALDGASFAYSPAGSLSSSHSGGAAEGGIAIWGSADYTRLSSGGNSALSWDGSLFAFHLGSDTMLDSGMLVGVSLGLSRGSFNYSNAGTQNSSGTLKPRMVMLSPYIGWSVTDEFDAWASLGFGRGRIDYNDSVQDNFSNKTELLQLVAGGRYALRTIGDDSESPVTLSVKSEIWGSNLKIAPRAAGQTGSKIKTQGLRVALEASQKCAMSPDSCMIPSVELGFRWDGGDGETGAGAELGGGVKYSDFKSGITASVNLRYLIAHKSDNKVWGVGAMLRRQPVSGSAGMTYNASISTGRANSEASSSFWERSVSSTSNLAEGKTETTSRFDSEIGYGVYGSNGLVTPYIGLGIQESTRDYRVGTRFSTDSTLELQLEFEHHESDVKSSDNRVVLKTTLDW